MTDSEKTAAPAEQPEEAPPAPPDLPPWEVPAPHRDKLDELVENAKQLDNFRIK